MSRWGNETPADHFWSKVEKTEGCWLWTASKRAGGYGQFYYDGKRVPAHRFAYELIVGQIPEGKQLDHLCRNPGCVNPEHLEPVTQRENLLRGEGWAGTHARKTHCPQGHVYDEANTVIYNGKRNCKTCRFERNRARTTAAT